MKSLIALSIIVFLSSTGFAQISIKWSEGEHLELGETGALQACYEVGIDKDHCPISNIQRRDKRVSFLYGELVTAGDFYHVPMDLYYDTGLGITTVVACAHHLLEKYQVVDPHDPAYTECDMPAFFTMPGYFEVTTQNYNHFGWNNMAAYAYYHQQALDKARAAFLIRKTKPTQSKDLLDQALILNGFSDHYLTDAFASGHIRTPRIQVKQWAIANLSGPLAATRGDVLTMILHDNESRSLHTGIEEGFRVKNSRGDVWLTRGDQHLHTASDMNDSGFTFPLTALKESFKEIMIAWQTGQEPDGTFAAAPYVPFQDDVPLVEKLSPQYQQMKQQQILDVLYNAYPFFEQLIFRQSDFQKMLDHLPNIFIKFRSDVAHDIQTRPDIQKRLPKEYLNAYLNVE